MNLIVRVVTFKIFLIFLFVLFYVHTYLYIKYTEVSCNDKSIQFEEDSNEGPSIEVDVADTEENKENETTVLPSCDTEHPVQLARNNKSTNSLTIEKDVPANGHVIESEAVTEPPTVQNEVKIPKLELFMDKVFETNQHLNGTDHKSNDLTKTDEEKHETQISEEARSNENTENKCEEQETAEAESIENTGNEVENKDGGEEEAEAEETSPSQSMSSRATRWEALADIAAELPPSLAVDPITGQIYQIALPK